VAVCYSSRWGVDLTFEDAGGEPENAVFVNVAGLVRGTANEVYNHVPGPKRPDKSRP
jgi:hypothetical protein